LRETQLVADNAGIEEQQAVLSAARQSVNHCQIKAPFTGLILEKFTSLGSYSTPGSAQFTLLKADAVEIRLEIPVYNIQLLTQAKSLSFETSGSLYELKIRKILPIVDGNSKQQIVHLTITSADLPPGGSYGLVKFDTLKHFIPAHYIQKRKNSFGVFTSRNGKAAFNVLPDAQEGQAVESDLPADTLIINDQLQLIKDNEKIITE